jgi:hypothetical protein
MKATHLFLIPFLLVPACGQDDEGPKGREDPLTTRDGICEAWAKAACNDTVTRRCGARSADDCVESQADYCAGVIGDGPFLASYAKACVEDVQAAYADAELDYDEWQDVVLALEGACSLLNPLAGAGEEGSDEPATALEGGADCDPAEDVCVATHYCDEEVHICRLRAAAGDACCENDPQLITPLCTPRPCQASAYCDGPSGEQVCVSRGSVADECVTDAECDSGLFCVEATGGKECTDTLFLGTGTLFCDELS